MTYLVDILKFMWYIKIEMYLRGMFQVGSLSTIT